MTVLVSCQDPFDFSNHCIYQRNAPRITTVMQQRRMSHLTQGHLVASTLTWCEDLRAYRIAPAWTLKYKVVLLPKQDGPLHTWVLCVGGNRSTYNTGYSLPSLPFPKPRPNPRAWTVLYFSYRYNIPYYWTMAPLPLSTKLQLPTVGEYEQPLGLLATLLWHDALVSESPMCWLE